MQIPLTEFDVFCRRVLGDQVLYDGDDSMDYYLGEASPGFTQMMREHGLYIENGVIHLDEGNLAYIEAEAARVIAEYDDEEPGKIWTKYGLSSDDDVDYNGGYISIFIDALRLFIKDIP